MASPPSKCFISRLRGPPSELTIETKSTRNKICQALAEDAACRRPGVVDGLYSLDELAEFARLGHGVPTIRKSNPVLFKNRAKTDTEFNDRLNLAAPEFRSFNLKNHGLVLAGGAASSILMLNTRERSIIDIPYHDYDLFLVGHESEAEALATITALGDHLYICWGSADVYRTKGCITFHNPKHKVIIQVILRIYKTIGEVIHGFDLGSSAIAWDGERVFLTGLGKLAAECGVNVLNLVARRSSYESRLSRYFERGFDVVLPNLNHNLPALGGRLPYLFAYRLEDNNRCSCHLSAHSLFSTRPGWANYGCNRFKEDIETSSYAIGHVHYGSNRAMYKRNFHILTSDKPAVEALCALASYTPGLDVRTVDLDFDMMVSETGLEHPEPGITMLESLVRRTINEHDGASVRLDGLKSLLGTDRAAKLILDIIFRDKLPLNDIIAQTCAEHICSLKSRPHKIPFAFMSVEDGTALTGPFPREQVSLAEWYGEAYWPTK